jgi:tetratricopeptide (TPR) repeat protein
MEFLLSNLPYIAGALILVVLYQRFAPRTVQAGSGFSFDDLLGSLLGPSYLEGKLLRHVEQLRKQGDFLIAGKMLEDAARPDEAAQTYIEGQEYFAAATVFEKTGRHERAAELYLQAGDYKKAAVEFTAAGKAGKAAVLFMEKGNSMEAAKLFGAAGQWDKAADLFMKSGYPQRAADAYQKAGMPLKAAEAHERHFTENVSYGSTYSSTAVSPDQKSAQQAGKLYLKAGEPARALEVFVKGGYFLEAAEAALAQGQFKKAAEYFLRAEEPERAAEAYEKAGDVPQASILRGEVALRKDQVAEAAAFFLKGRDHQRAAELFEQVGMLEQAAKAYVAAESHAAAGSVYVRAGLPAPAAASYEKAGDYETAARLYEEAGSFARAADLYEKAGQPYRAGEAAARTGDAPRAIGLLQRVSGDDEHFPAATRQLAELLIATGRAELARERLLKALAATPSGAGHIDLHYWMGSAQEALGDLAGALDSFKKVESEDLRYRDVAERVRRLGALVAAAPPQRTAPARPAPSAPPSAPSPSPPASVASAAASAARAPRFALREELGRGPLGIVHRGEEPTGRAVAMRLLPDRFVGDSTLLAMVAGDIKQAAQLSSPHVAKVLGLVEVDKRPCVVTELVLGRSLADPLKSGARMGIQQVHSLGRVLAQTLSYLHGKNVVHGSVQPSNVMVASGSVKLMDVGLGRLAQMRRAEERYGIGHDATGDLFDLATLLYHLVTGVHPATLPQGAGLPLPSSYAKGIPESMDKLLVRALSPKVEQRLPTADALLVELRDMVKIT